MQIPDAKRSNGSPTGARLLQRTLASALEEPTLTSIFSFKVAETPRDTRNEGAHPAADNLVECDGEREPPAIQ